MNYFVSILVLLSCLCANASTMNVATMNVAMLKSDQMTRLTNDLTLTLTSNQTNASAVFYNGGRLYIGGRTHPAWLASMRGSDLGDTKAILFPVEFGGGTGEYKYHIVLKMQWLANELLVQFNGSAQCTISAVATNTWTWRDIISTNALNDVRSFCVVTNTVYVAGFGQAPFTGIPMVSSFTPPATVLTEWYVTNGSVQYAPVTGAGGSVYYVNGDLDNLDDIMIVKFSTVVPDSRVSVTTDGYITQNFGPEIVEHGDYLYLTLFPEFFGSDAGVVSDRLVRFHKTTQLVDEIAITGATKGAVRSVWSDGTYLWITRPGTISRYNGATFTHFNMGTDDPDLIVGDNADHLFSVEKRSNPVIVRRYFIVGP